MSLDWDVSNVKNRRDLDGPCNEPDSEGTKWNNVLLGLVYSTILLDLGEIKESNIEVWIERAYEYMATNGNRYGFFSLPLDTPVAMTELAPDSGIYRDGRYGAVWQRLDSGYDWIPTRDVLGRYVGFRCNVYTTTKAQWRAKLARIVQDHGRTLSGRVGNAMRDEGRVEVPA